MSAEVQIPVQAWAIILAAIIGLFSALLGSFLAQFLSYYRTRKQEIEELKATLFLITQLSEEEINSKVDNSESVLWFLKDELYQGFKSNVFFLREARDDVMEVILLYPNRELGGGMTTNPSKLKQAAKAAYESLDEIQPYQMLWLVLIGFFGFSQEKYADTLDDFLEESDDEDLSTEEEQKRVLDELDVWLSRWETISIVLVMGSVSTGVLATESGLIPAGYSNQVMFLLIGFSVGVLTILVLHQDLSKRVKRRINTKIQNEEGNE